MALHPLGAVDPRGLVDARLQLHHAAQLVAAVAQSTLDPREDDSHRALAWDSELGRFYSEPARSGLRAFVAADPLSVGLRREATDLTSLRLMGATMRTARAWMEAAVRDATGDDAFALGWPEYDLPEHFVAKGRPFQANATSLLELTNWFTGAEAQLDAVVASQSDAGPVLTWPHHLDMAALIVLARDESGAPKQTVGVGMSPGDASSAEPYWYVNAWGYAADQADFPDLASPGHTHREGWSGFVLTASELIDAGREGRADPGGEGGRQRQALDDFLARGIRLAKAVLEA